MKLKILNSKEVKEIHKKLEVQFGFKDKLDYAFLQSNKGKIYAVNKSISKIPFEELKIDLVGFYFASDKDDELRPSIEGSQIVGPKATKNVFEMNDGLFRLWFAGHDIPMDEENTGFLLIKHNDDFFGCGRIGSGALRNYVPKTRRITSD